MLTGGTKRMGQEHWQLLWGDTVLYSHCPFPFLSQVMDLKPRRENNLDSTSVERLPFVEVEGVPLLYHTAEQWGPIWEFQARPDDLICTYPRAGKYRQRRNGVLL